MRRAPGQRKADGTHICVPYACGAPAFTPLLLAEEKEAADARREESSERPEVRTRASLIL